MVDDSADVEIADDLGRGILGRHMGDGVDINDEQDDVGCIELPHALENTGCRDDKPALEHHSSIEHRSGITGGKHEQVGRAAESEIAYRQLADGVVRNVVQKQKPDRDPVREVEPEVAIARREVDLCPIFHVEENFRRV